jgi:DNA-binding transcriptional ArsR family regulator
METKDVVASLAALAQPTRLEIFRLLVQAGPTGRAAGEIAAALEVAPATLSFHLRTLSQAALVAPRQDGRYLYYAANFERMSALLGYLTQNCCADDGVACAAQCGTVTPNRPLVTPATRPRRARKPVRSSP